MGCVCLLFRAAKKARNRRQFPGFRGTKTPQGSVTESLLSSRDDYGGFNGGLTMKHGGLMGFNQQKWWF